MKYKIKKSYTIADLLTVILEILIIILIILLSYNYSFYPRYKAFKTKNYDCIWVQDAYSCMKIGVQE